MSQEEWFQYFERILLALLTAIMGQQKKAYYTVDEFAVIVNRSPFCIRQACNLGRLRATKASRCGIHQRWSISHAELERYQKEGLLPPRRP